MRSHAKASTAGSTQRQASGLGRNRSAQTAIFAFVLVALVAFAATSASASLQRNHESAFGTFNGEDPQALTVDQSTGDVYAVAANQDKVYRFDSAGLPDNFSAGPDAGTNSLSGFSFESFPSVVEVAVDNSGGASDGNVYVTNHNLRVFASSGEPLGTLTGTGTPSGSLGDICGVAVDQANGDVYLANSLGTIWRYSPSAATVKESDYSGAIAISGTSPCQIAVAQGNLYVHSYQEWTGGGGPLNKYATSAFALGSPPEPSGTSVTSNATAVAADPSTGDVYADEGNKITVYSSAGAAKYSFGSGDISGFSAGVAVKAGGNAYASDPSAHEIDVFGPAAASPPLVETKVATGVKHVKATLHGHLDPNDSLPIIACEFEWGTDTSYGEAPVPCAEGNAFNMPADVSAELSGLTPGTAYHFRLHVTTAENSFDGNDRSFGAIPASNTPEASAGESSIASATSSLLKGIVNPNANPLTDCYFEYVDDSAFQETGFANLTSGGSMPCDQAPGSIPVDFEDHEVSATASGLNPERIYRFRLVAENANGTGNGKDALVPGPPLVETTGSTWRTATTARLDSRVGPHGADTTYHFEYVTDAQFQANGFDDAASTPDAALSVNEVQQLFTTGSPGGHFMLSFGGYTTPEIELPTTTAAVQAALRALPSIGSPNVRVDGGTGGSAYTVTFQGALGNTDVEQISALPGTGPIFVTLAQTSLSGGAGDHISFVSTHLSDLQPNATYHYRVVADNGAPSGPAFGAGMTLATRISDAPLTHGRLPGPVGSDRAWEQVSTPDTGGNGVYIPLAIGDDGESALYSVLGGTPISEVGASLFGEGNQLYAERSPSGWEFNQIYPSRADATGSYWGTPKSSSDLSQIFVRNFDSSGDGDAASTSVVWRLTPHAPGQHVLTGPGTVDISEDGSLAIATVSGSLDPDHPVPGGRHLYDVTSGTPRLVDLLPDGSVPGCSSGADWPTYLVPGDWISTGGSQIIFYAGGSCETHDLYVRDLKAETTRLIASSATFIRASDDAVFFSTLGSLLSEDVGGRDVYRYDLGAEGLDCLTCIGVKADVEGEGGANIAVSDDGSRVYFKSPHRLLPGAGQGIYRVDVASGELAYVGPLNGVESAGVNVSDGKAITSDGAVYVFRSSSPGLDSLNGPQNGRTAQYYLYDDKDRSLVCVSCPADGSAPRAEAPSILSQLQPLSDDGTLIFSTPTSLVSPDQNTAGPGDPAYVGSDAYEWRDGRPILLTDGLTVRFSGSGPEPIAITPSGRDAFFTLSAQLTPDSIDAFSHLYDARIGGGFDFPAAPPPCPLEVCQGTPKGPPEESMPGSATYAGTGNAAPPAARCRKGKVRRRGRCIPKAQGHPRHHKHTVQHRANHDRKASR